MVVLFVGFFFIFAPAAHGKWVEVESENFLLTGRVKQKNAEDLLRDLEIYRAAILKLLKIKATPESTKVKVLAVKDAEALESLIGRNDFDGVYTASVSGPYFILNAKNGFKRNDRSRHTAIHEYTHHLLQTYSPNRFPRWYEEGYAEYLANFEKKGGQIIIGRPNDSHARALGSKHWMDWDVFFESIKDYPFTPGERLSREITDQDRFYAQSWLAVHYILNQPGEPQKFDRYYKQITEGVASQEAFKSAFGESPATFGAVLKAYYKTNKFTVYKLNGLDFGAISDPRGQAISQEIYATRMDEFKRAFDPDHQRALAEAENAALFEAKIAEILDDNESTLPLTNEKWVVKDGEFVLEKTTPKGGRNYETDLAKARNLLINLNWENSVAAQKAYKRLLKNYGGNAEIYLSLAKIYLEMSNLDAAQDMALKSLDLEPANSEANFLAGKLIMIQHNYEPAPLSEITRAQTYLRHYLKTGDDIDAHFFFLLATAELSDEMRPQYQSEKSIDKCLKAYTHPKDIDRVLVLAGYLAQMEKHVEALEAVSRVLASAQEPDTITQARNLHSQLTEYVAYKNRYELLYGNQ